MSEGKISPWLPEQDRMRLAILGKLAEEASELAARASRCIIQGLDELDPDHGLPNSELLQREMADVTACMLVVQRELKLPSLLVRVGEKLKGYARWHRFIREHEGKPNG